MTGKAEIAALNVVNPTVAITTRLSSRESLSDRGDLTEPQHEITALRSQ